jgi:serine/threonine-protein kinase
MERLLGESLAQRLARSDRMPTAEVVAIGKQLLDGIAAAHRAGVVHRDLKPGNVFFESTGSAADTNEVVKILDFGISKIHGDLAELTRTGETLGTFSHMAPEQIRHGGKALPQSDLWSIGIVLYRCLVGKNPFWAEDPLSMLAKILEHPPTQLAAVGGMDPPVVRAFQPFFDRALAKDLRQRFASAEEMRAALELAGAAAEGRVAPAESREREARAGSGRPAVVGVAAFVAALSGAIAGVASAGRSPRTVALEVEPPDAIVRVDGRVVEDISRVAVGARASIDAPGREARDVSLPTRAGARLFVRLAPAAEPAPETTNIEIFDAPATDAHHSPPTPSAARAARGNAARGAPAAARPPKASPKAPQEDAPQAIERPPY